MHRIETEHVRVVCENHQVDFFQLSFVLVVKRRCCTTTLAVDGYTCTWIHRGMLLSIRCVRASSVTVISGMLVYMDTPKDATQYPLCVRASSVTVISDMLVYGSHVVFLQPQIKCEVLSQAMEEG